MTGTAAAHDILLSPEAVASLGSFPSDLRHQSSDKLTLLATNPFHPSLNAHRLERLGTVHDKWECYINHSCRIIYDLTDGHLRIWYIGEHSIVDRACNYSFAAGTQFQRLAPAVEPEPGGDQLFHVAPPRPGPVVARDQPFSHLAAAHLRVLGVPRGAVKAVQECDSFEALTAVPGLSPRTVEWLEDLATDDAQEHELFAPDDLFFRTTVSRLQGYCDGKIRQLMLNLEPEQQVYVDRDLPEGAMLLKGCAGSGKTTVALYRAIRLAEQGESVLLLTFSKALSDVTQVLLGERIGEPLPPELEVRTVAQWCSRFLARRGHRRWKTPNTDEQDTLMAQAASGVARVTPHAVLGNVRFLLSEVHGVIKAQGLTSVDVYLNARRTGRGAALQASARRAVWAAFERYQALLAEKDILEWEDLPLLALKELDSTPLDKPYRHVIVDEAQDLTVTELRLAQRLGGSTFLVGDMAQSIYTRGYSWKEAGLALQGRSFSMRRNFRNSRQVAQAAAALIEHNRLLKASEDWVDPEATHRTGPWPIVFTADVDDAEIPAICERILDLAGGNEFRIGDFAVLCRTNADCKRVLDYLAVHNLPAIVRDIGSPFNILGEKVKIMTIHSAKGLEFPVVFAMGWHEGTLPMLRVHGDPAEEALELENERRLAYVAMTRASEALYLVTSLHKPSRFLDEIPEGMKLVEGAGDGEARRRQTS
jgi:superfamily I DNA/RNA helicase/mRNA-degrading endonuclease YafQ of YafQ-DinJ toxin-antitoxin module